MAVNTAGRCEVLGPAISAPISQRQAPAKQVLGGFTGKLQAMGREASTAPLSPLMIVEDSADQLDAAIRA